MIIREFKRILKQKELLILTVDISINCLADILQEKVAELIESLETYSCCIKGFNSKQALELLSSNKILTTQYLRKFDKKNFTSEVFLIISLQEYSETPYTKSFI